MALRTQDAGAGLTGVVSDIGADGAGEFVGAVPAGAAAVALGSVSPSSGRSAALSPWLGSR